ncbi:MAG: glycosyltransferase family 4 protein [Bacteroidetes bacterium]|nr:glycosyltransferase family 4 protein [Bacteroidota bacterium]
MKKVLIITYYWPPSGGAGVQRWLKMSKFFKDFDIELIVITVDEKRASYPIIDNSLIDQIPKDIRVYRTDSFEPLEIYRKLNRKNEIPQPGFVNETNPNFYKKIMRFIRGNFFIPDARIGWNKYAFRQCSNIINTEKIDTIITTGPPNSTHLVGLKLKKKYNLPWIADFRDPWTDIFFYDLLYHTKLAEFIDKKLEKKVIENADSITTVSDTLIEMFKEKSGNINPEKFTTIPNGFNHEDFLLPSTPSKDTFILMYIGSLSIDYNLDCMIKAFSNVIKANPVVKIKIVMIGKIDKKINDIFNKEEISDNLEVINFVLHNEVIKLLKTSTAVFFTIYPAVRKEGLISAKIFEYLAVKKPIICIGPTKGDVAKLIHECNAGEVLDYEDEDGITKYFQSLIDKWKLNYNLDLYGEEYNKYSRYNQVEKFAKIINLITDN